jgi:hypothetical protein
VFELDSQRYLVKANVSVRDSSEHQRWCSVVICQSIIITCSSCRRAVTWFRRPSRIARSPIPLCFTSYGLLGCSARRASTMSCFQVSGSITIFKVARVSYYSAVSWLLYPGRLSRTCSNPMAPTTTWLSCSGACGASTESCLQVWMRIAVLNKSIIDCQHSWVGCLISVVDSVLSIPADIARHAQNRVRITHLIVMGSECLSSL